MAGYKNKAFKNDPSVSSEYVKFLIMNTGMDLVDQLVKRTKVLEEQVKSITKVATTSESKASSLSNSMSAAQKTIDALTKRVASLESKK
jgi:phage shock protein A